MYFDVDALFYADKDGAMLTMAWHSTDQPRFLQENHNSMTAADI
jgi:hypothetical protein